jgi:hypothetical protein
MYDRDGVRVRCLPARHLISRIGAPPVRPQKRQKNLVNCGRAYGRRGNLSLARLRRAYPFPTREGISGDRLGLKTDAKRAGISGGRLRLKTEGAGDCIECD